MYIILCLVTICVDLSGTALGEAQDSKLNILIKILQNIMLELI